jgi:hypothetical protein
VKCDYRHIVVIVRCGTEDYYRFKSNFEAHPLPSETQTERIVMGKFLTSCEPPERGFGHDIQSHPPGTAASRTMMELMALSTECEFMAVKLHPSFTRQYQNVEKMMCHCAFKPEGCLNQ